MVLATAIGELIGRYPPPEDPTPEERMLAGVLIAMMRDVRWGRVSVAIEAGLPTRAEIDAGWKLR